MAKITCLHCGTRNEDDAANCFKCGRSMVRPSDSAPTDSDGTQDETFADRALRESLQTNATERASKGLFLIGILLAIGTTVIFLAGMTRFIRMDKEVVAAQAISGSILAALLIGFGFWARKDPAQPAIVGMVLFGLVTAVDLMIVLAGERTGIPALLMILVPRGIIALPLARGVQLARAWNKRQRGEEAFVDAEP